MIPKSIRALAALVWLVAVPALAAVTASPTRWVTIRNVPGFAPVRVTVADKSRDYLRVTPRAPLELTLDGPTRLQVLSRAEFAAGAGGPVAYHVLLTEGARILDQQQTETSPSSIARVVGGSSAGKSRRLNTLLPAGRHRLTLSVDGVPSVLVRLRRSRSVGKSPISAQMVTLTPVGAPRSSVLVEGERSTPYYSSLPGRPVQIRVVGPTTLDLTTRLDFDATMRGEVMYSLAVIEGTRHVRDITFRTSKATAAHWQDRGDVVPSKRDHFAVVVPQGTHEYRFELVRPARGTVSVHARIPQPSVGNEE